MKNRITVILLFVLVSCCPVTAQTGPAGVWQSVLDLGAQQKLDLQFIINKLAGEAYGVTVHYSERGTAKDLSATSVSYKDGKLAFSVAGLGGSYSGSFGNKTITGEWRQGNKAVPMVLTPYKRRELGEKDMEKLLGQWVGDVTYPDGLLLSAECRFEKSADGKLTGLILVPDTGGPTVPMADILIEGNRLRFSIPAVSGEYMGEFTPEGIKGRITGPGFGSVFNMARGKYRASTVRLDVPGAEMKNLQGRWAGVVGPFTIIFRFEQKPGAIFVDIPTQNVKNGRVLKASLSDGNLSMKMPGLEYTGKIAGDKIDGTLTPLGRNPIPLTLTRE